MFGFFTQRCDICGNLLKRTFHRWEINGRKMRACSHCNAKLEKAKSKQAFDSPDTLGAKKSSGGCLKWAFILAGAIVAMFIGVGIISVMTAQPKPDIGSGHSPESATATAMQQMPVFSSVDDAQRAAVLRYPELGRQGSEFNKKFLDRRKEYLASKPEYFKDTSWPMRLAEEIAISK